jgi:hypothetical protein
MRERRAILSGARDYVKRITTDPPVPHVHWLAAYTRGDADHAAWELRYLRFSIGILTARHHSLEDRLPAIVSHELVEAFARDSRIAAANLSIAETQFNARLRAYTEAYHARVLADSWDRRVGRALLEFAGEVPPNEESIETAAEVARAYFAEAAGHLTKSFGVTTLPEHIAPSEVFGAR